MLARSFLLLFVVFGLTGCYSSPRKAVTMDEFLTREVSLPSGRKVRAEVLTKPQDMLRGMMFRDQLPTDRGLLFIHGTPGQYAYWMYQVRVPLDIIWMDQNRLVTEISANTPPCPSKNSAECPHFGGQRRSIYVLELAAGQAAANRVAVGDKIDF